MASAKWWVALGLTTITAIPAAASSQARSRKYIPVASSTTRTGCGLRDNAFTNLLRPAAVFSYSASANRSPITTSLRAATSIPTIS